MSASAAGEETLLERDQWRLVVVPRPAPLLLYVYTCGLDPAFGHPELVLAGLREEQSVELLDVAAELIGAGRRFEPGRESWLLAHAYPARFRHVDPLLLRARLQRLPAGAEVLQLFWPDRAGRFPWMEGCDPAVAAAQRIG